MASTTKTLTNKTINCANNTCTVRIANDVSGLGTGSATALAVNAGSAGAFVRNNGDALSGTFTGAPTFSGNLTFSGDPIFTGLAADTQVSCLGLNASNVLVLNAAACGSGGGGSGTVTALTLAPGFATTPGTQNTGSDQITTTGTINKQLFPVAKTTNYTVQTADQGNLLQANGAASAITFTLPDPAAGNKGVTWNFGDLTTFGFVLTTTSGTATVGGFPGEGTSATFPAKSAVSCTSDGANYGCGVAWGVQPVAAGGTGLASGTSGGVLAYTASGTLASSGALTANLPVIGGGAGVAPSVGTRSGNTTAFVTTTGAQTSGDCVEIDANGNHIASGAACGGGAGISCDTNFTAIGGTCTWTKTAAADLTGNYLQFTGLTRAMYRMSCQGLTVGTVAPLGIQVGSGATTWKTAGSYYRMGQINGAFDGNGNVTNGTSIFQLGNQATSDSMSISVTFNGMTNTSQKKGVVGGFIGNLSGLGIVSFSGAGWWNGDNDALTAVRVGDEANAVALSGGSCALSY